MAGKNAVDSCEAVAPAPRRKKAGLRHLAACPILSAQDAERMGHGGVVCDYSSSSSTGRLALARIFSATGCGTTS